MLLNFLLFTLVISDSSALIDLGHDGNFGVNFLGFRAGINLKNGISTYAGTPFGQKVDAGFRDKGFHASAASGFGQRLSAGIGGDSNSAGGYAGASSGFGHDLSASFGNLYAGRKR